MRDGRIDLKRMARIGHLRRRPNEPRYQGNRMLQFIGLVAVIIVVVLVILWLL